MKENKKKYPILEEAKKKAQKIRGAKGYTQYKTDLRNQEFELLKAKVEMRRTIFERIKKIYDVDLALYTEAVAEYNNYIGQTKETTK